MEHFESEHVQYATIAIILLCYYGNSDYITREIF